MSFVLSSTDLAVPQATATAFVLHGALGAGHNFRSFARRLQERRPNLRCVLVDLRHHGKSQGAPPPNTLRACAEDLSGLAQSLGVQPDIVIGHSFGGKVALAYAASRPSGLRQLWILDSNPGPQEPSPEHEVMRVLGAMRDTPLPLPSREEVVQALRQQGLSPGLASWLSTNLVRAPEGYVWGLDLDAITELMADYFRVDLWPALERPDPQVDRQVVVAEHSDRWTRSMLERAQALPEEAGVHCHVVPNAGHWLHVDNPDGLLAILDAHLL